MAPTRKVIVSKPRSKMTALEIFLQVCRQEHKSKYPDDLVEFNQLPRKCHKHWKTMSDGEKERFQSAAINDERRYEQELQNYLAMKGEKGRGKKRRQKKNPNAPKRFLSAFFLFSGDNRATVKGSNPGFGGVEISKQLGRLWQEAAPEVKKKYEALSEKDKIRYEKEMVAFKAPIVITLEDD